MKNLTLLFATLLIGFFGAHASHTTAKVTDNHNFNPAFGYGNSFIFAENGITFSVFPNGEFDFYVNNTPYSGTQVNLSFNAGYNYSNCLQYDDYGTVIQVVNTPVFYDYYGRVAQIGAVRIYYNSRRVIRIGGLHIFYNPYGAYSHCSGYINVYNRVYVYRPFHRYFIQPVTQFCMVSYQPYRQYYAPVRYTYYKPYINNVRKCYATVGATYYYKQNNPKKAIYKNDKRVSRRGAAKNYNKVSKRSHTNTYEKASKKSYANTHKKSKNVTTPVKRYKAPAKKVLHRKSVVKHSPSKKVYRKAQYQSTPARNTKVVRKSSDHKKRTGSKTRGRNTRSRT